MLARTSTGLRRQRGRRLAAKHAQPQRAAGRGGAARVGAGHHAVAVDADPRRTEPEAVRRRDDGLADRDPSRADPALQEDRLARRAGLHAAADVHQPTAVHHGPGQASGQPRPHDHDLRR